MQKALAKDVNQRYQTAGELRNELAAFAESSPARPAAHARTTGESKKPWFIATGAIVLTALAIGLAVPSRHSDSDGSDSAGSAVIATGGAGTANGAAPAGAGVGTITPAGTAAAAKTPVRDAVIGSIAPGTSPFTSPGNNGRHADAVTRVKGAVGDKRGTRAAGESAAAVAHTGVIALAVAPWGEVIVDGNYLGVSPPLTRVTLPPGVHRIEVQNGTASPYRAEIEVKSGQTVALQHKF